MRLDSCFRGNDKFFFRAERTQTFRFFIQKQNRISNKKPSEHEVTTSVTSDSEGVKLKV